MGKLFVDNLLNYFYIYVDECSECINVDDVFEQLLLMGYCEKIYVELYYWNVEVMDIIVQVFLMEWFGVVVNEVIIGVNGCDVFLEVLWVDGYQNVNICLMIEVV